METLLKLPEGAVPCTIKEILDSLKREHLEPRHESKAWGDWISFAGYDSVIAIESNRGLSTAATIEYAEAEEADRNLQLSIHRAFARLGWHGIDEEGVFSLV